MRDDNIIHLPGPAPDINDVVACLRNLADNIEKGEITEVTGCLVVLPLGIDDYLDVYGYGDVDGTNHPIIQFELAKALFVNGTMRRNA